MYRGLSVNARFIKPKDMNNPKLTQDYDRLHEQQVRQYEFTTEEKITNEAGGSQSKPCGRADLLPPKALMEVAKVLQAGAEKYGEWNWKLIEVNEHINHAMIHLFAYNAGDTVEPHLTNATARLLFALELLNEQPTKTNTYLELGE